MNYLNCVDITRELSGNYNFKLDKDVLKGMVSFFAGNCGNEDINEEAIAVSEYEQVVIKMGCDSRRRYFLLVPERGPKIIVGERSVPFQGSVNFRDLGGYYNVEGDQVRWGKIYRSGHLSNLTQKDKELFSNLTIAVICDFRTKTEYEGEVTSVPGNLIAYSSPIVPGIEDERYFHINLDVLSFGSNLKSVFVLWDK